MKRTAVAGIVLVCAFTLAGCVPAQHAHYGRERSPGAGDPSSMTTHDVVELSRAGISDSVIVTMMNVSGSHFNLKTRDVIALADSGVSHDVINAMIKMDEMPRESDDAGGYAYSYPPYYWYGAYYPFWDPWYYRTPVIGFRYRSFGFNGGFGFHGGPRFHGFRGGGRHR